jgi:hypothetical protein
MRNICFRVDKSRLNVCCTLHKVHYSMYGTGRAFQPTTVEEYAALHFMMYIILH